MVQMILSETADPSYAVRLRFYKRGSLSFIAHLDLVRTLTKAISRAGIPVRYSEGFNPHPRLSFATAMSIGLESDCEFLDIRLTKTVDPLLLMQAFNESLTPELQATEAYLPEPKFTDIAYASYTVRIVTDGASPALAEACTRALSGPVVVFKRSKSGDKDTDISEGIRSASVTYEDGALLLSAVLKADNAGFINPEYLVTHLKNTCGILAKDLLREHYTVLRTGLFLADMTPFR